MKYLQNHFTLLVNIDGSCYKEFFRYIRKAHFQSLYPVNHARSNPEILFTYPQLIMQQIHSLHLRVYSCFQCLTSRDFISLDSHITIKKPWKLFLTLEIALHADFKV